MNIEIITVAVIILAYSILTYLNLKKFKKQGSLLKGLCIALIFLIILLPILIYILVNEFGGKKVLEKDVILSYYGSIIGASLASFITLVGLYFTLNQANKSKEEEINFQKSIIEDENKKEIDINLFFISNDLKKCFTDIIYMLTTFAEKNSTLTQKREKRKDWILSWKSILRTYSFSNSWREQLKVVSKELNSDYIKRIYEMYTILDKVNRYIGNIEDVKNYKELYKKIENLPKEEICSKRFLDNYNELKILVDRYDLDNNNEDKCELKVEIYKRSEYFSYINKKYEEKKYDILDVLSDEWKNIFKILDKEK